jgi:hypothetical protein
MTDTPDFTPSTESEQENNNMGFPPRPEPAEEQGEPDDDVREAFASPPSEDVGEE